VVKWAAFRTAGAWFGIGNSSGIPSVYRFPVDLVPDWASPLWSLLGGSSFDFCKNSREDILVTCGESREGSLKDGCVRYTRV
jgi:hypothetical protein